MTDLGKIWTDSVAYLALSIGAGLSIAGNVADTARTRGQDMDTLDIVMAVSWPVLVVLMVEIFVSTRWTGLSWPMQILRWLGTVAIGGMAMRVSWVHLNDLMLSRDQKVDVAVLGPLAIDCLAIMATALILAGRRTVSTVEDTPRLLDVVEQDIPDEDMDALRRGMEGLRNGPIAQWTSPDSVPALDTNWTSEEIDLFARLGAELDSTTTPAAPVVTAELPVRRRQAVRGVVNEVEAIELAEVGRHHGLKAGDIAELLAGYYGVSTRTIRRIPEWRSATS
jgi:hypothetical protein